MSIENEILYINFLFQDVIELLEKRVKSRFSHRQLHLLPTFTFDDYMQLFVSLLTLPKSFKVKKYASEWNKHVEVNILKTPPLMAQSTYQTDTFWILSVTMPLFFGTLFPFQIRNSPSVTSFRKHLTTPVSPPSLLFGHTHNSGLLTFTAPWLSLWLLYLIP